jgi:hypothetical protein
VKGKKKVFWGCGGLFALFVIFLVVCFSIIFFKNASIKKQALPIVKKFVPVVSTWNYDNCKNYLHSSAFSCISQDKIRLIFKKLATLGKLKSVGTPKLINYKTKLTFTGNGHSNICFLVPAEYENGKAEVIITLVNEGDELKVYYFKFNSDFFLK